MTKEQKEIIKAVSTIFFQEGFDRNGNGENLDYWKSETGRVSLFGPNSDGSYRYMLNTEKIKNQYYLRLSSAFELDDYDDENYFQELLLIPINHKRLCWEEFTKCVSIIEFTLYGDIF